MQTLMRALAAVLPSHRDGTASDDVLSVVDAAARIGVAPDTIHGWIDGGTLPALAEGKIKRVLWSDVLALFRTRAKTEPTVEPGRTLTRANAIIRDLTKERAENG